MAAKHAGELSDPALLSGESCVTDMTDIRASRGPGVYGVIHPVPDTMATGDVHEMRRKLRSGFWQLTQASEAGTRQALVLGNAPKKAGATDRRVVITQPITVSATVTGQSTGALGVTYVEPDVVRHYVAAVENQTGMQVQHDPACTAVALGAAGVGFRSPRTWMSIPETQVPAHDYGARLLLEVRSKVNPLPPAVSGGVGIVLELVCDQVLVVG